MPSVRLSTFVYNILSLRPFQRDFCGDPLYLEGNDQRRKKESSEMAG
jgi:hypothetical protein